MLKLPQLERSCSNCCNSQGKVGFVDGLIKQPTTEDPAHGGWIRCDPIVLSSITNSVSKEIASSIIYLNSAEAMWKDLKGWFPQENGPRICRLRKIVSSLT